MDIITRQFKNIIFLFSVLLLITPLITHAVPPQTMSYQAYLKDNAGLPVNATQNITFRMYSVASGGSALWTETQNVTVTDGLFSVELGGVIPLPKASMNDPLWLGIEVLADGEASPRTQLNSTNNAFVAEDADTVDGLHANEIIDAASDEVRTPISSLPFSINTSGSYYLTGNLSGSSGGISINVDDVTLDLMGFTIDGGGSVNDYGIIFTGKSNVTIKDGTVKRFGLAGIYQNFTNGSFARITDVRAMDNGTLGSFSAHSGIFIRSFNSHIESCAAGNNGGYGIGAGRNSILKENIVFNNNGVYALYSDDGSLLSDNAVYSNTGTYGLYGGEGSLINKNVIYLNNTLYALYGYQGSSIIDNTAFDNTGTYAIYGGHGANLSNNTSYRNDGWGLYGVNSNHIKGNTVSVNNQNNTAGIGGLRVGFDSRVKDNTLSQNNRNGIYVNGSDNVIRENHIADSTNGLFFVASGNYYKDNTGAGNTTNFNLNGTSQTNGGGNVGF